MTEEVNPSLIKEVQTVLSKYIKKPPLNEKLLKKPPFRYLHDLITSIIRETGFLNGLYSDTELNSENVKDKDAKLNFLDKLILAIKKVTGKNVVARSGKIIAGLEVNKTLELLLIIGKAIDDKVDCSVLVQSTVNVDKENQKSTPKKDEKPAKSIVKQKPTTESKPSNKIDSSPKNTPSKTKSSLKTDSSPASKPKPSKDKPTKRENSVKRQDTEGSSNLSEQTASNETSNVKEQSRDKSSTRKGNVSDKIAVSKKNSAQEKRTPSRKPSLKENNKTLVPVENAIKEEHENLLKTEGTVVNGESQNNISAKNSNQNIAEEHHDAAEPTPVPSDESKPNTSPNTELPDISSSRNEKSPKKKENTSIQRPSSARPGSRRFSYSNSLQNGEPEDTLAKEPKSNRKPESEEITLIPVMRPRTATRPPSARPGAPRIRDRGEVSVNDEMKAPTASINVIEEGKAEQNLDEKDNFIVIESEQSIPPSIDDPIQVNNQDRGQLVNQILQTQKELNESLAVDVSQHKHSEIEWEAGRQRERDIVTKEIDKIRTFIQTLTSAANPLGKLFDFLQEDVDEMQRELQHWKKINENLQKQQLIEMNAGKLFLQPLQKQLEDIENSIQEEYIQIANIKSAILLNDEKIMKLIPVMQSKTK